MKKERLKHGVRSEELQYTTVQDKKASLIFAEYWEQGMRKKEQAWEAIRGRWPQENK